MLREVKNKHVKPRIVPFKVTVDSSTSTVNIGYGDYTTTKTAAGRLNLLHRMGFSRNGLVFVSQSGIADGGYVSFDATAGTSNSFDLICKDKAGSNTAGSAEGFCFGWDNTDLSICKSQNVAATQNAPRVIWGKIASAGTVSIGTKDFTCTSTVTGVYNITFTNAFGKPPLVKVTGISTSAVVCETISTKTATSVVVNMADETGALVAADFYILVIGSDSSSDSARGRLPLENSQRKPRIVACQITNTAGTPTLTIGGATGGADFNTLTDNGAGDFSITITESFIREPAIFLCTTRQRVQVHSYAAGVIRLLTKTAGGTDTDVTGVTHVFVIGSDDAAQY